MFGTILCVAAVTLGVDVGWKPNGDGGLEYIVQIIEATRTHEDVRTGVSPRGGVHLCRAAQALAVLRGRDYVLPDDVKELAVPVLSHRVRCQRVAGLSASNFDQASRIVREILYQTPVPL